MVLGLGFSSISEQATHLTDHERAALNALTVQVRFRTNSDPDLLDSALPLWEGRHRRAATMMHLLAKRMLLPLSCGGI